jgi:hypothetical protein
MYLRHRPIRSVLVGLLSGFAALFYTVVAVLFGFLGLKGLFGDLSDTSVSENRDVGTALLIVAGIAVLHIAMACLPYTRQSRSVYAAAIVANVLIYVWGLWPLLADAPGGTSHGGVLWLVASLNLMLVGLRCWATRTASSCPHGETLRGDCA